MGRRLIELGRKGEEVVCKELEGKGYEIVAKNERTRYGEIDIIASKENHLLFVEVKTRTSFKYGMGDEAVHYYKQNHFTKSVICWIGLNKKQSMEIRLKVATVHFKKDDTPKITWLRML